MNLMHPVWFPSIAWFRHYLKNAPLALTPLTADELQSSVNRTIIRGPNGLQQISIPLEKGPRRDLRTVKPLNSHKWAKECKQALNTAYGTSAFYRYYDYLLEPLLFRSYEHLFEMNTEALKLICSCFRIPEPEAAVEGPGQSWAALSEAEVPDYGQYFTERYPFTPEVGVLDVLFHCGPLGGLVLSGAEL